MFPKFSAIPVNGQFTANGSLYVKSSAFTYLEVKNELMGEFTIEPFMESRIEYTGKVAKPNTEAPPTIVAGSI